MTPKQSILSSLELIKEIKTYSQYKKLSSKAESDNYNDHIVQLLNQIKQNSEIVNIKPILEIPRPSAKEAKLIIKKGPKPKVVKISSNAKQSLLKELSID